MIETLRLVTSIIFRDFGSSLPRVCARVCIRVYVFKGIALHAQFSNSNRLIFIIELNLSKYRLNLAKAPAQSLLHVKSVLPYILFFL